MAVETLKKRRDLGLGLHDQSDSFYDALKRGVPACYGNALGFDRLLTLALGKDDIKHALAYRRYFY